MGILRGGTDASIKSLCIIISLLLISCARQSTFDKYIHEFEQACDLLVSTPFSLDTLMSPEYQGGCYHEPFKHIHINSNIWDRLIEDDKRKLIYHELVHCELGIKHEDGMKQHYKTSDDILEEFCN